MTEQPRHRRDRLLEAAESSSPGWALFATVRQLLTEGTDPYLIMEDLGDIRGLLTFEQENEVLDLMDCLLGDCGVGEQLLSPEALKSFVTRWKQQQP